MLTRHNKVETAVHGCNLTFSLDSIMSLSRYAFYEVSALHHCLLVFKTRSVRVSIACSISVLNTYHILAFITKVLYFLFVIFVYSFYRLILLHVFIFTGDTSRKIISQSMPVCFVFGITLKHYRVAFTACYR